MGVRKREGNEGLKEKGMEQKGKVVWESVCL